MYSLHMDLTNNRILTHNTSNTQDVISGLYVPYVASMINPISSIKILKYKEIRRFYNSKVT